MKIMNLFQGFVLEPSGSSQSISLVDSPEVAKAKARLFSQVFVKESDHESDEANCEVLDEKEGGEPGAIDGSIEGDNDSDRNEYKDDDEKSDHDVGDETKEIKVPIQDSNLEKPPIDDAAVITIFIELLTAASNNVSLASQLASRYWDLSQILPHHLLTSMDVRDIVARYPKRFIWIGQGDSCVIGLLMEGSSKRSVIEHAKQLSISSMTRENTHEAADVIRELLMSSANYTLTWSQLTGQYRVRLPDGPFVRQVIGLWPNQFHVTDNDNVVTLIMNNNDPLKEEDDEVIISELHDDNDNNDPGGDGSNDGFEHGVNAKQRKKLIRSMVVDSDDNGMQESKQPKDMIDDLDDEDQVESKAGPSPYRPSRSELNKISPLWIKLLKLAPARSLPSLSLCQITNDQLGIPIANDSVGEIIRRCDQFCYGGYGITRVITYIDPSFFIWSSKSEMVKAARNCANDESKKITTRQDGREAADALEILLHNAGGSLPIDSIGEPIRQQLPDSPLILRVVELYNDRFVINRPNIMLRNISPKKPEAFASKTVVKNAETKLPTRKSSSSSSSDIDFLVNYLEQSGPVNIGGIGSSFKTHTGRNIGSFLKNHLDKFVLTSVGRTGTMVSLATRSKKEKALVSIPIPNVVAGASFASVVAGTASMVSPTLPIVNATPIVPVLVPISSFIINSSNEPMSRVAPIVGSIDDRSSPASASSLSAPAIDLERRLMNVLALKGSLTTAALGSNYASIYGHLFPGLFFAPEVLVGSFPIVALVQ
jgi:hypothetical protein